MMSVFTACCAGSTWKRLSVAAAKAARSRLRNLGTLRVDQNWPARAAVCESCPMRVIRRGVSYCGKPLLEQPVRDLASDGCGCPTVAKAKTPGEHCPLDSANVLVQTTASSCRCKWCAARSQLLAA
ncbi:hypothetical protein BH09PLA1_BH09PLA1_07880 [soil metagenome]